MGGDLWSNSDLEEVKLVDGSCRPPAPQARARSRRHAQSPPWQWTLDG